MGASTGKPDKLTQHVDINVQQETQDKHSLFAYYQQLIALDDIQRSVIF